MPFIKVSGPRQVPPGTRFLGQIDQLPDGSFLTDEEAYRLGYDWRPGAAPPIQPPRQPRLPIPEPISSPPIPINVPPEPIVTPPPPPPIVTPPPPPPPPAPRTIYDPTFADVRRQLGLGDAPSYQYATPGGEQYLRDLPQSEFDLFTGSFGRSAPNLGKVLSRYYQPISSKYTAATAFDPKLSFRDFLSGLNTQGFYKALNPFERGERPSSFQRGFKTIG